MNPLLRGSWARAAALALTMLVVYLAATAVQRSADNGKALRAQAKEASLERDALQDRLTRLQQETTQRQAALEAFIARQSQLVLRLLAADSEAEKQQAVREFLVQTENIRRMADAQARQDQANPRPRQSPSPRASSRPGPRPSPTRQPSPRPSPSRTQQPPLPLPVPTCLPIVGCPPGAR